MVTAGLAPANEIDFVQYMECTNPLESISETITCICLRSGADDEHDHIGSLQTAKEKRSLSAVGERFRVKPFSSV